MLDVAADGVGHRKRGHHLHGPDGVEADARELGGPRSNQEAHPDLGARVADVVAHPSAVGDGRRRHIEHVRIGRLLHVGNQRPAEQVGSAHAHMVHQVEALLVDALRGR